ncbi:MAG: indole-3-glycerol phosphate synthase TrpC [Verrucomicrobiota bacterium]
MSTKLDRILKDVDAQIARSKQKHSIENLKSMIKDAPRVRSFKHALESEGFGIIAEIKEKSPSGSAMRKKNVTECLSAYEDSTIVKAVSVLTEEKNFGMSVDRIRIAREVVSKPLLRKDFIKDVYQVYEARAYHADAILLMANVIPDQDTMRKLAEQALDLGMDVLFESHTKEEIEKIPADIASIYGINCRMMDSGTKAYFGLFSRYLRARVDAQFQKLAGKSEVTDKVSTDFERFRNLVHALPEKSIKVAESGISPSRIKEVQELGFNSALIGTSLLLAKNSVRQELSKFEARLNAAQVSKGNAGDALQSPVYTH